METAQLLELITQSAVALKAIDSVIIDFEQKSSITDYALVCNGTSTAHNQGIAERISLDLKKENILPLGIEGDREGEWILMDYNSVVVHIFTPDSREDFALETLFDQYKKIVVEG
ncbi:MAG: ribosome-associated protein [bacterium]|jgi:ribosome-associated protein